MLMFWTTLYVNVWSGQQIQEEGENVVHEFVTLWFSVVFFFLCVFFCTAFYAQRHHKIKSEKCVERGPSKSGQRGVLESRGEGGGGEAQLSHYQFTCWPHYRRRGDEALWAAVIRTPIG